MKLLAFLFLIVLLIGVIVIITGCVSAVKEPPTFPKTGVIHKIVHLDPLFSGFEKEVVKNAFMEWTDQTNGFITWTFDDNWPEWETQTIIRSDFETDGNCSTHLLVLRAISTDQMVINAETQLKKGIIGLAYMTTKDNCDPEFILFVMDKVTSLNDLRILTLHEVGHNLGLHHNNGNSVMTESIGNSAKNITVHDLHALCKYYQCS